MLFGSSPTRADTLVYTVTTCIDGENRLSFNSSGLQWQYETFTPVGVPRGDRSTTGTFVSSTLNGSPVLTNAEFDPVFATPTNPGALSQVFALSPGFPTKIGSVSLTVLQGRGSLTIFQLPTAGNGETLILDFNDNAELGAAVYSAEVTVTTTPTTSGVPEPGMLALLASGIGSLAALRKRMR